MIGRFVSSGILTFVLLSCCAAQEGYSAKFGLRAWYQIHSRPVNSRFEHIRSLAYCGR